MGKDALRFEANMARVYNAYTVSARALRVKERRAFNYQTKIKNDPVKVEEQSKRDAARYIRVKDDPVVSARRTLTTARWKKANRKRINANISARCKTDPQFRMGRSLRSRFYSAVKRSLADKKCRGGAVTHLGCSFKELVAYLEAQFQDGMSWDNWSKSGWHVDHIRPLASFDLSDLDQLKAACHYTNLRPLWATENLQKNSFFGENNERHTFKKE